MVMNTGRLILVGSLLAVCTAAADDETGVFVDGHRDEGRWFLWTVTNQAAKPITYFKAPHDYGYTVNPPDGWDFGLADRGRHGVIECEATTELQAIRRGHRAEFRLEVQGDYQPAPRPVMIGFADGTKIELAGVLCPMREPFLRNHFPAIGLGVIFAAFLVVQAIRSRKKPPAAGAEGVQ